MIFNLSHIYSNWHLFGLLIEYLSEWGNEQIHFNLHLVGKWNLIKYALPLQLNLIKHWSSHAINECSAGDVLCSIFPLCEISQRNNLTLDNYWNISPTELVKGWLICQLLPVWLRNYIWNTALYKSLYLSVSINDLSSSKSEIQASVDSSRQIHLNAWLQLNCCTHIKC